MASRREKYARVERERRFLVECVPEDAVVTARRLILDRYIRGTRLRLRRSEDLGTGNVVRKLTQKIPAGRPGATRGLVTTAYLDEAEYAVLAALPADVVSKTRLSVPPLGVDVFDPPHDGLVVAEAEFTNDRAAREFVPPAWCGTEVTDDGRYTGARLASTASATTRSSQGMPLDLNSTGPAAAGGA